MLEDDLYRTSTQYRLWSFTEESLRTTRANTNAAACSRVRAAIRRAKETRQSTTPTPSASASGTPVPVAASGANGNEGDGRAADAKAGKQGEKEVECLTPEEELELVRYYCEKTMELGAEYSPPLPTAVRATAIQYLRRFYLTNSPMSYHPKTIMPCALFLATKTDNYYISLSTFSTKIPNSTMDGIIGPEFLLTQGLRFTFDVRHPFRGLEGGIMELNAIAQGQGKPGPHHPEQTAASLQNALQSIPPPPTAGDSTAKPMSISTRIAKAHHDTREILKTAAQFTDAYFLYTPPQIWLAALLVADKPLAEFYLDTKLGPASTKPQAQSSSSTEPPSPADMLANLRQKLTKTLDSCADLFKKYLATYTESTSEATLKNLKRIDKKRYQCQKILETGSLALNKAQKRESPAISTPVPGTVDGAGGTAAGSSAGVVDEAEAERVAKKRKLEREKFESEGNSIFGGELVRGRKRKADE